MKLTKEQYMFYAVGTAALIYLILTLTREHMTVQDVEDQQEKRKTAKDFSHTKEALYVRPASTSKKVEKPIIGPKAEPVDPNDPAGGGSNGKKPSSTGTYPEIYGGNYNPTPGHKDAGGGDSSNPPPYDFVPAAEFPAGPSSPMPFLNDFSKILKYN